MSGATLPVAVEGRFVVIHAPKCLLVLSAEEIANLVHLDTETWIRALRRGKAHRRAEATRRRTSQSTAGGV